MAKVDYNWLIGAGIGFALGGPIGAIVGGVIGSQIQKGKNRLKSPGRSYDHPYQRHREHYTGGGQEGDLILSFLVLAAAITKADNKILSSEIHTLKEFLVKSFGTSKAAALMKMYKEILGKPIEIDKVCSQINIDADNRFKRTIVQSLFEIAVADGEIVSEEENLLVSIAEKIGLPQSEFSSISSIYSAKEPDRDYKILELSSTASDSEIKTKYRELVKKYHPDKVSHLGEEFKTLADKKFKEINSAYKRIKDKRGF